MSKKFGRRDGNILASFRGYISLKTFSWKNKKKELKNIVDEKINIKKSNIDFICFLLTFFIYMIYYIKKIIEVFIYY